MWLSDRITSSRRSPYSSSTDRLKELLCPGRSFRGPRSPPPTHGPYDMNRFTQESWEPGFALTTAGPTTDHGPRCASIRARAQPGSGKQWVSPSATTGAPAARTPADLASGSGCRSATVHHSDAAEPLERRVAGRDVGPGRRDHHHLDPVPLLLGAEVLEGRADRVEAIRGEDHGQLGPTRHAHAWSATSWM